MNFKSLLLGSTLLVSTLFGGVNPAEAGLACGSRSFVIEHTRNDSYVMFHNGGNVTFNFDDGTRAHGTWWWSGKNVVTSVYGNTEVWPNVGNQTCDSRY